MCPLGKRSCFISAIPSVYSLLPQTEWLETTLSNLTVLEARRLPELKPGVTKPCPFLEVLASPCCAVLSLCLDKRHTGITPFFSPLTASPVLLQVLLALPPKCIPNPFRSLLPQHILGGTPAPHSAPDTPQNKALLLTEEPAKCISSHLRPHLAQFHRLLSGLHGANPSRVREQALAAPSAWQHPPPQHAWGRSSRHRAQPSVPSSKKLSLMPATNLAPTCVIPHLSPCTVPAQCSLPPAVTSVLIWRPSLSRNSTPEVQG